MKRVILFDPALPVEPPKYLTIDDDVASLMVRSGVAVAADAADAGPLSNGPPVSSAFPVPVAIGAPGRIVVPLAVANAMVASGGGKILPEQLRPSAAALLSADGADFLISPIDGRQLLGAK